MSSERLAAYRAFVEASAAETKDDGYLFDTPRCRFELEPSDELVAAPGARLAREGERTLVQLPSGAALPIVGIEPERLRATWAALPCRYSRVALELGPATRSFVEQCFSRVLFAPAAVAELEVELPALEIVRFPGSPYEVVRSYWRNCIAVRRRLEERGLPRDTSELRRLLLELHELMLLGEDGGGRSSFYLPASLLGRKRPVPGRFYEVPSELERRGAETILTRGARVSAPLLGGLHYWQLLAESVDDIGALADERELTEAGAPVGRIVRARAEQETRERPWFLPPRPLTDANFAALLSALTEAHAAEAARDLKGVLAALGSFHYRFVRLHPLPSANQSLSMSFVSSLLRRVLGVGIPHLLLDQMALRFEERAYRKLFARAARAWCAPLPSPSERMQQLARMTKMLNGLVHSLNEAPSLLEARALLPSMSYAAELALLTG